ncbi:MAG: phosphoglucosamine mutase [Clostridia bacterium]|nr:phosphoglucosamine mutase [Clostridia bacterium]
MSKYFGTDGFRAHAGKGLTSVHAFKIGRFLGWYLSKNGNKARIVIGKDTRRSSYMLEYAISAGIATSGASAYMLHVTTTPCVSYVTSTDPFDMGIMISASHNPYYDNGIKILNSRGEKIDDEIIEKIEAYLDKDYEKAGTRGEIPMATDNEIGEIIDYTEGRNRYIGYLISTSRRSFKGLKIALDTSNGGGWMIARSVFSSLGAKVISINSCPDGTNINKECGSTCPQSLIKCVLENECDMGFAYDGDADRCIAVDHTGKIVNGDYLIYILANELKTQGELLKDTVVTTVMSNLGLYKALDEIGVGYEKTKVGDRYVYECMQKNGFSLGGEQSGHIILSKYATTGDGILTSIKITEAVIESKSTLYELSKAVNMMPQVLKSIPVKSKWQIINSRALNEKISAIENELGKNGRVLVRASGTEELIRIMIEAENEGLCEKIADEVAEIVRNEDLKGE